MAENGRIIGKMPMPTSKTHKGNEVDVMAVKHFLRNASPDFFTFVLEEPGGSKSAKAAASMAGSFGRLHALAVLMGYRFVRITPQSWQKPMLKCKAGDTKDAALRLAKELWPREDFRATERCKISHDGMVDAALICEHARRNKL